MTKQELELKLENLQKLLDEQNASANAYRDQIQELQKELKDINKPKLTGLQLDEVYQAIEQGIESFDFDDCDNYDTEFHIDYDNRIALENMSFQNADELLRVIYNEVRELFAEAKKDNNQENQD